MNGIQFIKIQPKYFSKGDIVLDYSPLLPDSEAYEVINTYKHNIHLQGINNKKHIKLEYASKAYWYCMELNDGNLG